MGSTYDCGVCERTKLLPANYLALYLIQEYGLILSNGVGTVNPEGLRYIFDLENIPTREQKILTKKIIAYVKGLKQKDK